MDRTAAVAGGAAQAPAPAVPLPMEMPIMHDGDRYEHVRDIGSGNFGVARLMRCRATGALVAVKYIERGQKIDENVQREIINHRSLCHPNIIQFKEVSDGAAVTAVAVAASVLFCSSDATPNDDARFFFQQLISGVSYCHSMQICHRDLKLENTLLDGSTAPRLKICDFGYSKSSLLHSQPKSTVGTPAYIAPEVLMKNKYNGKISDVWSCGVTLYVMLVGGYPFEDPEDPKNFRKTIQKIMGAQYAVPDYVHISPECRDLLSRIFVVEANLRITIPQIKSHPWFLKNLPIDIMDDDGSVSYEEPDQPMQNMNDIMQILAEATIPPAGTRTAAQLLSDSLDVEENMEDLDSDEDLDMDIESSGEVVVAL
ncbi:hypothetical protein C2845_PM06G32480 [Panicum miliaceum]|uniref:non-specific serine/threonine protein kinase n=1 Tax=Panicum miliaceum TaxID=4540 RepID=A0A3L6R994_PANMI|nr:hypothetical protein C2845_PM06G32480 [Panicum miliaceum]